MNIRTVTQNKKDYLPLLLLGDEQETMIDRYLERGTLYVLEEDGAVRALCVVTDEGGGVLEIKNLATDPAWQRRGCARALVDHVADAARGRFAVLQAGTGESPLTVPFYEACGFCYSRRVKNFFTDHYDHPIWEGGVQLVDMVYYRRAL